MRRREGETRVVGETRGEAREIGVNMKESIIRNTVQGEMRMVHTGMVQQGSVQVYENRGEERERRPSINRQIVNKEIE